MFINCEAEIIFQVFNKTLRTQEIKKEQKKERYCLKPI